MCLQLIIRLERENQHTTNLAFEYKACRILKIIRVSVVIAVDIFKVSILMFGLGGADWWNGKLSDR